MNTKEDLLRENLAAAIASCAPYRTNTQELGRLRTVTPIVGYMVSTNPKVHRTTAMALQRLSEDPQNCITMHQVILNAPLFIDLSHFIYNCFIYRVV